MNNVLFRRGDQTFIDENVLLNDGQIIFNETDEAIYLDNTIGDTVVRKRYGGGNLSRSDIDMALSTTSENPIANKVVTNAIGNLSSLQTDVKTNLVSAINEVNTKVSKTEDLASNTQQMIAPILTSLVAPLGGLKSGDQFIYNGLLYKATAAIAQGGTIIINGNCALADSVTKQIKNVMSNLSYSTQGLSPTHCTFDRGGYCKVGDFVVINIRLNTTGNSASVRGFPAPRNIVGFVGYDGTNEKPVTAYMSTDGTLQVPSAYTSTGGLNFSFCYLS